MKAIVVILLLVAGGMIGHATGYATALWGIKRVWPDLYAQMLERSEPD